LKRLLFGGFIAVFILQFSGQSLAHGGVEHNTADGVVTLFQTPLSPVTREYTVASFIFADKTGSRLTNMPVKLTVTDTYYGDESKDKVILTRELQTDANGLISFGFRYPKPDYYDLDLDFDMNGKPQEAGFLIQVRNPYKTWYSLTYLFVLRAGAGIGWFLHSRRSRADA
jgi:hypothetical protein